MQIADGGDFARRAQAESAGVAGGGRAQGVRLGKPDGTCALRRSKCTSLLNLTCFSCGVIGNPRFNLKVSLGRSKSVKMLPHQILELNVKINEAGCSRAPTACGYGWLHSERCYDTERSHPPRD